MSESTPFAEPAKQWLRLHLRWEVGGGIMGFVCAVAVNTCWALSEYRAAECCTALCLIVLLLWVWVWNLPKLARAIVAALTIGAGIWVVSQLEGARTHALAKKSAQVGFLSEKTRSSIFIHANQLMAARSVPRPACHVTRLFPSLSPASPFAGRRGISGWGSTPPRACLRPGNGPANAREDFRPGPSRWLSGSMSRATRWRAWRRSYS